MIVRPHQIFHDALSADYAVGAFFASDVKDARSILRGAKACHSPIILQTGGESEFVEIAESSSVPVALHVDGGDDISKIKECISRGYSSVSVSGNHEDVVADVVRFANERGAFVEVLFDDVRDVRRFMKRVGAHAVGVCVDLIPGAFTGQSHVRFDSIMSVQGALPSLPIVLRGFSGTFGKQFSDVLASHVSAVVIDESKSHAVEETLRLLGTNRMAGVYVGLPSLQKVI